MENKMLTDETKKNMYKDSRLKSGLNQPQWARLFNMDIEGKSHVSEKETGARGVNKPEALAAQLLLFIAKQGFDIDQIKFDESGYILEVPVKINSTATKKK
jgi:DNA-binding transcriptional regulator YiaG